MAAAGLTDCLELIQIVADFKPEEKKVLVIDEFPYLVKTNPAFSSILQNAWDEILKDSNVMLILSGSAIFTPIKGSWKWTICKSFWTRWGRS